MPIDTLMVYVGVYNDVDDAESDYQLVKDLHREADLIDAYDAAVVERREGGKTKIVKKHETPTRVGGVLGGGVGLATGLVVGQENPLPNIYNLKLYEVQKYVMMTDHMQSVLSVFVNEKVWQSIPAADRKILEDTMAEVGRKTLDWDRDTAAKYRKDLEAKGMVFVEEKDGLDIEAFRKAVLAQVGKDFPEWSTYIEQIRAVK